MITRKVFIVLFAVFFLAGSALAAEVEGVKLPDTAKAGDQELILNGAGQKLSSGIGVYVGALYLKQKSGDATAILAADEPMNVKMVITSFMVNSDNMKSGFRDAFKECATTDLTPLKTKIDAFVGTFKEVNDRDVFDLAYVPGKGVEVSRNGKASGVIEGMDFKKALYGIWVGDKPIQKDLKAKMLGK